MPRNALGNIGTNLENKFRSCNDSDFKLYLSHPVSESMYCEPISTNEILDIIAKLNNNKSPGPDMITPYLFKDTHIFDGKTNISFGGLHTE